MDDPLVMITLIVVVVAIITIPSMIIDNQWKLDTIQRGLAIYCPSDGQWAWKGECK